MSIPGHQQAIDSMALAASNAALVDRFRERLGDADDGVRMTALEGTGAIMQSAIQGRQIDGLRKNMLSKWRESGGTWDEYDEWIIDMDILRKCAPATLSPAGPAWILVVFEAGTLPPSFSGRNQLGDGGPGSCRRSCRPASHCGCCWILEGAPGRSMPWPQWCHPIAGRGDYHRGGTGIWSSTED